MNRTSWTATLFALVGSCAGAPLAVAQPFVFHCTGDACRVVGFLDEGNGCVVATNTSRYSVRVTFGAEHRGYDVGPGETEAPINDTHCAGYYEGGETANFIGPTR